MVKSTAELTMEYINNHPYIKSCLKSNLINYSSLSRLISKEIGIEKKTSMEAILIAARRYKQKLDKEVKKQKQISNLLENSEVELKNKVSIFIISKNVNSNSLEEVQKEIRKKGSDLFIIEGSDSLTMIVQDKVASVIQEKLRENIIKIHNGLAQITFKSPKDIEDAPGVIAHITSILSENGINIIELASCWTDTLIVINPKNVIKAMELLKF